MATRLQKHVSGIPVISPAAETENSMNWIVTIQNGSYRQSDHFNCQLVNTPDRFKQSNAVYFPVSVRLSTKLPEAVRRKLSLGARILQVGGMEKVFKHLFGVSEKEILIKASQCYLSTTADSLAGLLFISTEKVAFCSDKSIKLCCPTGDSIRIKYKVAIPLSKIEADNQSENSKRPAQKYIQIVTGIYGIYKSPEVIQVLPAGDFPTVDGRQEQQMLKNHGENSMGSEDCKENFVINDKLS